MFSEAFALGVIDERNQPKDHSHQEWLDSPAGTLMPMGDVAMSFYETPKLLDIATGKVLQHWPELSSGRQNSSIIWHVGRIPPIALDPLKRRFAVADLDNITVVQLG